MTWLRAAVSFWDLIVFSKSAFKSATVSIPSRSKSLTNSSSNWGNSRVLTSCKVTLNTASAPANSAEWYCSGNVTVISLVSPAVIPINCSSNPGMKELDPITNGWFSPFPPSNATPSLNPS